MQGACFRERRRRDPAFTLAVALRATAPSPRLATTKGMWLEPSGRGDLPGPRQMYQMVSDTPLGRLCPANGASEGRPGLSQAAAPRLCCSWPLS